MAEDRAQSAGYAVTPDHMSTFGSIVQSFARHEYLMHAVMGKILMQIAGPADGLMHRVLVFVLTIGCLSRRDTLSSIGKMRSNWDYGAVFVQSEEGSRDKRR